MADTFFMKKMIFGLLFTVFLIASLIKINEWLHK